MKKIMPIIMSGGAGSRLWPLSRAAHPKQLLPLVTDKTMIQETVIRLSGDRFLPPVFICNAAHAEDIKAQMAALGREIGAIIVEPFGRNTAPCAVAAALHAAHYSEDPSGEKTPPPLALLLPADHHVKKPEAFVKAIEQAVPAAESGHLVTFGIAPNAPETGYGYIEKGERLDAQASHVKAFHEKPDLERAQKYFQAYLDTGNFAWNAGIFLFAPGTLLNEMAQYAPEIFKQASRAFETAETINDVLHLGREAFEVCPSESIDYAVMEPTKKAAIVLADIGWTDIGSFAALHEELKTGEDDNAVKGDVLMHNSRNCLVQTDGPIVAVVGVEGLSIIVKDDKILISAIDASQDVKAIVTQLKSAGRSNDL